MACNINNMYTCTSLVIFLIVQAVVQVLSLSLHYIKSLVMVESRFLFFGHTVVMMG